MRFAKSLTTVFLATLALTATDAFAKDVVYRWVDDQGVVHFGDRSSASADAEEVQLKTPEPADTQPASERDSAFITQQPAAPSRAQQQREERARNRRKAADKKAKIATLCNQNRRIVARLEPRPRVMVTGKDGQVYRLDDNARLKALGIAKAYLANNCKG